MATLETLIQPLFLMICNALSIDDQCAKLTSLSKTIKKSLNFAETTNFVSITVLEPDHVNAVPQLEEISVKRTGRLPYLQHAHKMHFHIEVAEMPVKRRKNVYMSIKKALLAGRLRSLVLDEIALGAQPSLTIDLLPDIGRPTVQLQELYLEVDDAKLERPREFWGSLKECKTLKYLRVSIAATIMELQTLNRSRGEPTLESLMASLPESMEYFMALTGMENDEQVAEIWCKWLAKKTWLPHLRRFIIEGKQNYRMIFNPSMVAEALKVVMDKTKKPRPFDFYYAPDLRKLEIWKNAPLTDVRFGTVEPGSVPLLEQFGPEVWPKLNKLNLTCLGSQCVDMLPLVKLAAVRPVEQFTYITPSKNRSQSWSDEIVQQLAATHSLRYLRIDVSHVPLFRSADVTAFLPPNCWSRVIHMELEIPDLTESKLASVLKAAPSLRWAWFKDRSNTMSPAFLLVMVLHHCRLMINLTVEALMEPSEPNAPSIQLKQVRDAFTRYPLLGGHPTLKSLKMNNLKADPDAFDYLMRMIGPSPDLFCLSLPPVATNPLCLYATRHLQSMHTLLQLIGKSGKIGDCIKKMKSSRLSGLVEMLIKPNMLGRYENRARFAQLGEWIRHGESFDEIVGLMFASFEVYPVFKGATGKHSFYSTLFELLKADQKALSNSWDRAQ